MMLNIFNILIKPYYNRSPSNFMIISKPLNMHVKFSNTRTDHFYYRLVKSPYLPIIMIKNI